MCFAGRALLLALTPFPPSRSHEEITPAAMLPGNSTLGLFGNNYGNNHAATYVPTLPQLYRYQDLIKLLNFRSFDLCMVFSVWNCEMHFLYTSWDKSFSFPNFKCAKFGGIFPNFSQN